MDQTALEQQLIAYQQVEARHTIKVMKALIADAMGVHEVDFNALAQKVSSINALLDGDEQNEGYQAFAALSQKLNNVEASAANNAQAIANLQTALNNQIETLNTRINAVEKEGRDARKALDERITELSDQYTAHVAASLTKNNEQDTRLDDLTTRVQGLEAYKALVEGRISQLETDNTTNKSDIAQIKTALSTQAAALEQELTRAKAEEKALRDALAVERERIDDMQSQMGDFATRQNVADANKAGAGAFCNGLWSEAGITKPDDLPMP